LTSPAPTTADINISCAISGAADRQPLAREAGVTPKDSEAGDVKERGDLEDDGEGRAQRCYQTRQPVNACGYWHGAQDQHESIGKSEQKMLDDEAPPRLR